MNEEIFKAILRESFQDDYDEFNRLSSEEDKAFNKFSRGENFAKEYGRKKSTFTQKASEDSIPLGWNSKKPKVFNFQATN